MSFKMMMVEKKWIECDGCGYMFREDEKRVELIWNNDHFHFHDSQDHGYDCFTYWLDKGRALILSERNGDRGFTEEELRIAEAVAALIPPIGKPALGDTNKALAV